jgi:hypothetical protein
VPRNISPGVMIPGIVAHSSLSASERRRIMESATMVLTARPESSSLNLSENNDDHFCAQASAHYEAATCAEPCVVVPQRWSGDRVIRISACVIAFFWRKPAYFRRCKLGAMGAKPKKGAGFLRPLDLDEYYAISCRKWVRSRFPRAGSAAPGHHSWWALGG